MGQFAYYPWFMDSMLNFVLKKKIPEKSTAIKPSRKERHFIQLAANDVCSLLKWEFHECYGFEASYTKPHVSSLQVPYSSSLISFHYQQPTEPVKSPILFEIGECKRCEWKRRTCVREWWLMNNVTWLRQDKYIYATDFSNFFFFLAIWLNKIIFGHP